MTRNIVRLPRCLVWRVVIAVLLFSNLVAVLPREWTLPLIAVPTVSLGGLVLQPAHTDPPSFILVDSHADTHLGLPALLPVETLENWLAARRMESLARHAKISLWASKKGEKEHEMGQVDGESAWHPIEGMPIRWRIAVPAKLPPGEYTFRALLFAEPPNGMGPHGTLTDEQLRRLPDARAPGAIRIPTTWTPPLQFAIVGDPIK